MRCVLVRSERLPGIRQWSTDQIYSLFFLRTDHRKWETRDLLYYEAVDPLRASHFNIEWRPQRSTLAAVLRRTRLGHGPTQTLKEMLQCHQRAAEILVGKSCFISFRSNYWKWFSIRNRYVGEIPITVVGFGNIHSHNLITKIRSRPPEIGNDHWIYILWPREGIACMNKVPYWDCPGVSDIKVT